MSTNPSLQAIARKQYKRKTSVSRRMSQSPARRRRIVNPLMFPRYFADQPRQKFVKLKYCQACAFTNTNGALGVQCFRANSLYDPDLTGSGHQPYGFDQVMAQYNFYTVISCSIKAELFNPTPVPAEQEPTMIGISLVDIAGRTLSAFGASGIESVMEMPHRSKTMTDNPQAVESTRTITNYVNLPKFFGKTIAAYSGDGLYRGDSGHDPIATCDFEIWRAPLQADENPRQDYMVTLIYTAVFSEPKWFTTS